jgi:predicted phosphodiesterase
MFEIKDDYDMLVWKLPEKMEYVNIYPLGDTHFGSPDFNQAKFNRWIELVEKDDNAKVILLGDMLDNALRNSKTNIYKATLTPIEQKRILAGYLEPIKGKIIAGIQGNHEARTTKETGDCPLYDVMAKLDLEHLYRENMAFIKVNLGKRRADRQWSYGIVASHGASRGKVENFIPYVDGMDVFLSGHTHTASSNFPAKIVMDMQNEVVRLVPITPIVVPSFADYGGYAMKGLLKPTSNHLFPVVELSGTEKGVKVHWI